METKRTLEGIVCQGILDNAIEGIIIAEIGSKKFKYANTAVCDMFGYTLDEMLTLGVSDIHPANKLQSVIETFDALARGEITFSSETPCQKKDGTVFWADINASTIMMNGIVCSVGFFSDVTNRLQANRLMILQRDLSIAFSKSIGLQDVLNCLLEHILRIEDVDAGGIYLLQRDTGALDLVVHYGLPKTFIESASHYEADSPQTSLILKGEPLYIHYEKLQVPKDDSRIREGLKEIAIIPLKHEDTVIGALNITSHVRDEFTELTRNAIEIVAGMIGGAIVRAQTHDALHENEKKIRTIVETAPMAIATSDINGIITSCNEATLSLYGYSFEEELIGKASLDLIVAEDRHVAEQNIDRLLHEGTIKGVEYKVLSRDGKIIPIVLSASVLRKDNDEPTGLLFITQDVSEAKVMEEKLRQSDKIQAVGQLAGGIAHDFNNQLAGIVGYADLLREELANNPDLSSSVDNILLATKRAADLTSQLLAFARKGKYLSITVDIHNIIYEVVGLLQRTISKRIVLKQHLEAQQAQTQGDPTQIQNAIINVALNARDAMPKGGELILSTSIVKLDEEYCRANPYEINPGSYVQINITDNGIGMDKTTQKRIFEPFFTTKEHGKGTGMGLASVYGTLKNHNGAITVESELGRGTSFNLYFPQFISEETVERQTFKDKAATGTARVLLVDDEEFVLDTAAVMLQNSGYHVSQCRNGKEAVMYYKNNWNSIDIVVLDMVMPEMDGRETFVEMMKINPNVKVLLSSGYSINGEAQQLLDFGVMGFIQKPYRRTALSQKVDEVLKITL